jgi:hypothetical protein
VVAPKSLAARRTAPADRVASGTRPDGTSTVNDLLAVDFLLQHPSILAAFADLSSQHWRVWSLPSSSETLSSEEALLRWKRAVGASVVAPMLGRLIARGLITHHPPGDLRLTARGGSVAQQLSEDVDLAQRDRIALAAAEFRDGSDEAHDRLRLVLEDRAA